MYRHIEKNEQSIYSHVTSTHSEMLDNELYIHIADCLKRLHCGYMKSSQQNR